MKTDTEIKEASAEMLLNYLYPEMAERWTVYNKGSFYRNYNRDILDVYADGGSVELTRDGFLDLLPEGLLTDEEELKGDVIVKSKELGKRIHLLREAFLPIDSIHFRQSLRLEREVASLVRGKVEYLLKEYFGYDLQTEQNSFVKAMAPLLPYAKGWRGDYRTLRRAMEYLFSCPVTVSTGRYSHTDSTLGWLPSVTYKLAIPGLTTEQYLAKTAEIKPFASFVEEWFLPVEVVCQMKITGNGDENATKTHENMNDNGTLLDYNSNIE